MGLPSGVIQRNREAREKRQHEAKRNLISELGLAKDVDPDITSAIFSRVPDPVYSVRRGKAFYRQYTKQQTADLFTKNYQAELAKIGQPELAEAVAAGSDPRTVETLKTSLISAYTTPKLKGRGPRSPSSQRIRREKAIAEQTRGLKEDLTSDAARQADLVNIRRRREKAVEQATVGMRRKRGKASLLSGEAGGAGFFQRYFT